MDHNFLAKLFVEAT